jgi:membrane protease YdiL (CAAX protease family)
MPFTLTILATLLLYTWVLEPRGIPVTVPAAVIAATAVVSNVRSGEWGLSPGTLVPASRATALFTLPAVLLILAAGMTIGTLHDRADFLGSLAPRVAWGGAQQWLLQTVVLRETRRHLPSRASVVAAALLFALVHAPNVFLMSMTCVGALGWCAIYTRSPNIIPLAVSHAIATLAIMYAFDDDLTGGLQIGRAYLTRR